jgi:hypothetical protein
MSLANTLPGGNHAFARSNAPSALMQQLAVIWQSIEAAQQLKAERVIADVLKRMDDEHLRSSGYTPQQIARIRSGAFVSLK